jgi:putative FmdB family regulatory protein
MPTYEYHCDACEHNFDEFQSFSEPALTKCPECGKKKLRRVFGTGAAILFKGSGFYETDYRSESYKSAAKADKEASSKSSEGNGKADASGTNGTSDTAGAGSGGSGKKGGAKTPKSKD